LRYVLRVPSFRRPSEGKKRGLEYQEFTAENAARSSGRSRI